MTMGWLVGVAAMGTARLAALLRFPERHSCMYSWYPKLLAHPGGSLFAPDRSLTRSEKGPLWCRTGALKPLKHSVARHRTINKRPQLLSPGRKKENSTMAGKGRTLLCPQEVGAIKAMVAYKLSNGAIVTALGIPMTAVSYHAANARRATAAARQDNRGLPKLLSPRELHRLRRVVDGNPFASTAEIVEKVNQGRTSTAVGPPLRTKDELFTALQEEWASIPSAYFKKLSESMRRRVRGVVAANGSGTKD
ncbi:hypothetical protein I4F81_010069 [Pyropia yezoensis]|uniref:Uncharacterized protein n=1 Tax=Pyropia yezoensis TaxID=2788 RepID=A0ACC3CBX9_PYRYE|nr:hypothetical protein I4F81_010069 [Neopyropia yezoensis]